MSRLTIDTTEAQSFDSVEEAGLYNMVVDSIDDPEVGVKSGNKYVWVNFKFEDPNIHRHCGKTRRSYPIEGPGSGFFREFWKVTTGQEIPMDMEIDVETDDAIGTRVVAQVTPGDYEGRPQNEVGNITAAG